MKNFAEVSKSLCFLQNYDERLCQVKVNQKQINFRRKISDLAVMIICIGLNRSRPRLNTVKYVRLATCHCITKKTVIKP